MKTVIVFAEGQTEEAFIKDVVAPSLWPLGIFLEPRLLKTSKTGRGGAINYDRLKLNVRNTLRQRNDIVLTTFLDFYELPTDFPSYVESQGIPLLYDKVEFLENRLHDKLIADIGFNSERFIPHIQPHEFEGLLFSDVNVLVSLEPGWEHSADDLRQIYGQFENPEYINNSFETKPSKRLESLLSPKYRKVLHGSTAAKKITLERIEQECPHFKQWMNKLRSLDC